MKCPIPSREEVTEHVPVDQVQPMGQTRKKKEKAAENDIYDGDSDIEGKAEVGSSVYGPIRGMRLSSRRWNPTGSVGSIASESKVSKDSFGPMFRLRSSSEEIQDLNQKLNHTCHALHKTKQELVEAKSMLRKVQSGGQDMMHAMKRSLRKAKRENETLHARLQARREMRRAEMEDMEDRLLSVVRENQVEEISNIKGVLKRKDLVIEKLSATLSGVSPKSRRLQRDSI